MQKVTKQTSGVSIQPETPFKKRYFLQGEEVYSQSNKQ